MSTSTFPFGTNFAKDLVSMFLNSIDQGTRQAYHMLWDILMTFLSQNLLWVAVFMVMILVFAFLEYLMTGRWANLGSVLYSYTYYGIILFVGLVFGPEIFANDWVDLILFIVYIISFLWVRILLNRSGIRRGR